MLRLVLPASGTHGTLSKKTLGSVAEADPEAWAVAQIPVIHRLNWKSHSNLSYCTVEVLHG